MNRVVLAALLSLPLLSACQSTPPAATPATAPAPAATDATAAAKPAEQAVARTDDGSERICQVSRKSGSNLPSKVCRTRAEWDAMKQEAEGNVRDMQRSGGVTEDGG